MTELAMLRSRDVVEVVGPDAEQYLQGQLSQDLVGLSDGESAWSFVLAPNGKVEAWLRVNRRTVESFLLDLDGGFADHLIARLSRFLLRTRCQIQRLDWEMFTVMGIKPPAPLGGLAVAVNWPGLDATDLLGPKVEFPQGMAVLGEEEWDRRRIVAGIPVMGKELTAKTLPAATGLVEKSVSFSKGCYTGQELVARTDSRSAGPPTKLALVECSEVPSVGIPDIGSSLEIEGESVGTLTSVVTSTSGFVALAYVKRACVLPTEASIMCDGETSRVTLTLV